MYRFLPQTQLGMKGGDGRVVKKNSRFSETIESIPNQKIFYTGTFGQAKIKYKL